MNSRDVITLTDAATGASAAIAPSVGFNCFRFAAPLHGRTVEVLWSADDFGAGGRPSASGVPLLFPFAGRLRGTSVTLDGRRFPLAAGDGRGNAIHGFVLDRPWEVLGHDERSAWGRFRSTRFPELKSAWPSDWELECRYELSGGQLRCGLTARNAGGETLPFSLGTHPYFRLPLGPGGSAEACVLRVPAARYWELSDMLPTGRQLPADGERRVAAGLPMAEAHLDDMFTGLSAEGGRWTAAVEDRANGARLEIEAPAPLFRECVVYNPPHRQAVCIEPYTAVPDAPELAAKGFDTGWRTLAPGESLTTGVDVRLLEA